MCQTQNCRASLLALCAHKSPKQPTNPHVPPPDLVPGPELQGVRAGVVGACLEMQGCRRVPGMQGMQQHAIHTSYISKYVGHRCVRESTGSFLCNKQHLYDLAAASHFPNNPPLPKSCIGYNACMHKLCRLHAHANVKAAPNANAVLRVLTKWKWGSPQSWLHQAAPRHCRPLFASAMSKWVETTAKREDTLQGRTEELCVLRGYPAAGNASSSRLHPARLSPTQQRQGATHAVGHSLPPTPFLLKAFTPAHDGEPADSIKARISVMDDTWAAFETRIKTKDSSVGKHLDVRASSLSFACMVVPDPDIRTRVGEIK
eukprot:1159869-Pelagomonas_calceolata.AAC.7